MVISNSVTINGINVPSTISISGNNGEYSINGSSFTAASGSVKNGDSVIVRQTSSSNYLVTTLTTLTVGGVSAQFQVETIANPNNTIQKQDNSQNQTTTTTTTTTTTVPTVTVATSNSTNKSRDDEHCGATCKQYKHYKAIYKNSTNRDTYFQVKNLQKIDPTKFNQLQTTYKTFEKTSKKDLALLSTKIQTDFNLYKNYNGYKHYRKLQK